MRCSTASLGHHSKHQATCVMVEMVATQLQHAKTNEGTKVGVQPIKIGVKTIVIVGQIIWRNIANALVNSVECLCRCVCVSLCVYVCVCERFFDFSYILRFKYFLVINCIFFDVQIISMQKVVVTGLSSEKNIYLACLKSISPFTRRKTTYKYSFCRWKWPRIRFWPEICLRYNS